MPGVAILAAAAATAFVVTTEDLRVPLVPPSARGVCAKTQCVVMTKEQLEEVFREGVRIGAKLTIERMQASCLKDET